MSLIMAILVLANFLSPWLDPTFLLSLANVSKTHQSAERLSHSGVCTIVNLRLDGHSHVGSFDASLNLANIS